LSSIFADISFAQLVLIAGCAIVASLIGGVSGYGSGALMPLVLVPIVGAAPVVPIIALAAIFTNTSRMTAFRVHVEWRKALIVLVCAIPTCVLGAWGYSRLTGRGALFVIGGMMVASVPLRRILKSRGFSMGERGLAVSSIGWGIVVGGTSGAGIILISMLMATSVSGAAVIATDAAISIFIGVIKVSVFGVTGVVDARVIAIALLIGFATFPGAFVAKWLVERLPIHIHTAILDVVVLIGGATMVARAIGG
jgi:uncharacterized membrane protein YfcA